MLVKAAEHEQMQSFHGVCSRTEIGVTQGQGVPSSAQVHCTPGAGAEGWRGHSTQVPALLPVSVELCSSWFNGCRQSWSRSL